MDWTCSSDARERSLKRNVYIYGMCLKIKNIFPMQPAGSRNGFVYKTFGSNRTAIKVTSLISWGEMKVSHPIDDF